MVCSNARGYFSICLGAPVSRLQDVNAYTVAFTFSTASSSIPGIFLTAMPMRVHLKKKNVALLLFETRLQKDTVANLKGCALSFSTTVYPPLAIQIGWKHIKIFSLLDSKICLTDLLFLGLQGAFSFAGVPRRKSSIYVPARSIEGSKLYSIYIFSAIIS